LSYLGSALRVGFDGARASSAMRGMLLARLDRTFRTDDVLDVLTNGEAEHLVPAGSWQLSELAGVSQNILDHTHFRDAQAWIVAQKYAADVCLFLPCHRVKPYVFTPTIREVVATIPTDVCIEPIVLSVPGVVPVRYSAMYPFAFYDWDPDDERTATVVAYEHHLEQRVGEFFERHRRSFRRFVGYFRPASSEAIVLQRAARRADVEIILVPRATTVGSLKAANPVSWRFRGLKMRDCLQELSASLTARTVAI
jgi:predicted RNA-binding protein